MAYQRQCFDWRVTSLIVGLSGLPLVNLSVSRQPVAAIQYADGTVGFSYPLRLIDSASTSGMDAAGPEGRGRMLGVGC